ncbi:cytochrome P450 [Spinellus fusiger]|nr:cytochrome P450 [Spinellus fusiger]
MGVQDYIFISDPTFAHEVFNINGNVTFSRASNKFSDTYYSVNGRGIGFVKDKKKLKESRLAANSWLSPNAVDKLGDMIQLETSTLVERLIKKSSNKEGIYPFQDIELRSLNVILRVCVGIHIESSEDPICDKFIDIVHKFTEYSSIKDNIDTYVPVLSFMNYFQDKEEKRRAFAEDLRNPLLRGLISQAIKGDVDCLAKEMKESDENNVYDEDDMLAIISDLVVAGTDTVSVAISRAFFVLSHHPEVQKKLCVEIDAFITKHKRLPTFEEREEFPYILSVQRELMRLYPVTPYGLPHFVDEDFVVNNYMIKKGTVLVSDMYSMHRNPDVFPSPDKFIPERFMNYPSTFHAYSNGNTKDRDQFNFGWGRRICPGIYLAETEMFYAYTTLWARCTIEPVLDSKDKHMYSDSDNYVDNGLVINSKPYTVKFVERLDKLI